MSREILYDTREENDDLPIGREVRRENCSRVVVQIEVVKQEESYHRIGANDQITEWGTLLWR